MNIFLTLWHLECHFKCLCKKNKKYNTRVHWTVPQGHFLHFLYFLVLWMDTGAARSVLLHAHPIGHIFRWRHNSDCQGRAPSCTNDKFTWVFFTFFYCLTLSCFEIFFSNWDFIFTVMCFDCIIFTRRKLFSFFYFFCFPYGNYRNGTLTTLSTSKISVKYLIFIQFNGYDTFHMYVDNLFWYQGCLVSTSSEVECTLCDTQ